MNTDAMFFYSFEAKKNVKLSTLTTVKTGGVAKWLVEPRDESQLALLLTQLKQQDTKFFVLGKGSNVLASDKGFDGVVIKIGRYFGQIELLDECVLEVGAGASTSSVSAFASQNGLSGIEFLASIPATIGGAVVMNAGCFGRCMADVTESVETMDYFGNRKIYQKHQLLFGYRTSVFEHANAVVTKVILRLKQSDKNTVEQETKRIFIAKRASQPIDLPSFGSVFKRFDGKSPAVLIDKLGFKGFCVGGAKVSDKHANFFVNTGNACTEDFLTLIDIVGTKVAMIYKVVLQPEVKFFGDTFDLGRLSYSHLF